MQSNFTREDLIRHLYNETNPAEATAIEAAIQQNPDLKSEMQQLREAKMALDNGDQDQPHISTLESIMAYSTEKNLQETH